uniref:NHLP bacteriocin export ABC transporter permease/ATPase subunit n=1 Tax=Streptomyces sp. NBC_00093 TaxID=2975649 RepID=A0AAU1ZZ80_9ACTN
MTELLSGPDPDTGHGYGHPDGTGTDAVAHRPDPLDSVQPAHYGRMWELASTDPSTLAGDDTLWLVTGGALDLFAADAGGRGHWRFLGRAEPGALLPSLPHGDRHVLTGRATPGCALYRVRTAELIPAPNEPHDQRHDEPHSTSQSDAFITSTASSRSALAAALDAGLSALLDAVRQPPPPLPPERTVRITPDAHTELGAHQSGAAAPSAGAVTWIRVVSGQAGTDDGTLPPPEAGRFTPMGAHDRVRGEPTAVVAACTTSRLLSDGSLRRHLDDFRPHLMSALSRRVIEEDRQDEARLTAGRRAREAALDQAVHALREHVRPSSVPGPDTRRNPGPRTTTAASASAPSSSARSPTAAQAEHAAAVVVEMVAEAAGITASPTHRAVDHAPHPDPVHRIVRIARTARLPSRPVDLTGTWWRTDIGPLVGFLREGDTPVALLRRRGHYEMADPSGGPRVRVTARTAGRLRTRAVTFYRPLPDDTGNVTRLLFSYGLHGCRADLLRLTAAGLAAVALGLLVPIATGQVLGRFVPDGQRPLIIQTCLAVIVAGLVAMGFGIVRNLAVLRIEGRFETTVQAGVWDRLLRLPASFFGRYSTGELAGAALGVSRIGEVVSGVAMTVVQAVLLVAVNFALQLWYSPPLALLSATMVALSAAVLSVIGARELTWHRRLAKLDNALTNKVFQTLRGLPKLRVAAAENYAYAHWARDFVESQRIRRRVRRLQNAVTAFGAAYVPFCTFILLALLAGPARDAMPVDGILTFTVSFTTQLTATAQLVTALTSAGAVIPLFGRLEPILTQPPEISENSRHPGELTGAIDVRGATFRYSPDGPPVLDDVTLRVRPGEFVAVVGPSGCGKSTLLRLLLGFAAPESGSVHYDGQDLAALDLTAVRRQCGVVLQHAQPFTGTVLSNIRGAEAYSLDEVREAARMAGLADDIAQLPMGLHTVLSDNGSTFSAGQRQRLMIAQALIRRPRILFLDEATSALDNHTQRIVTESTRALRATRVVIAHRLSTIMEADRVIVLSEGRIVQSGPPDELLADATGLFHHFVRRQVR